MIDNQIMQAFGTQQVGSESLGKIVIDALIAERKNMFLDGIMKVLIFSLFVFGVLYLYGRKILSAFLITIAFILVNTVDLLLIDKKYLNENNYIDGDTYIASNFTPTKADELILQDKDPHFRVFNLSGDRFSETKTSYFHRSIGGYHAAKLRNYQDLIETKFSEPGLNKNLINILDAKYLIIPPQSEDPTYRVQKNDSALGAAWFVENLIEVSNQVKELQYLDSINPSNTAVVEKNQGLMKFKFEKDSSKLINLVKYRNDTSVFQTITASEQYAVFSEIYYPNGWNAYIDGKPVAHNKVNYLLRGLIIPAGKHEVQFIFEPRIYKLSSNIAYFFGWSLYLCLIVSIGGTYLSIKKRK